MLYCRSSVSQTAEVLALLHPRFKSAAEWPSSCVVNNRTSMELKMSASSKKKKVFVALQVTVCSHLTKRQRLNLISYKLPCYFYAVTIT